MPEIYELNEDRRNGVNTVKGHSWSFSGRELTSLRKELGVNGLKVLLIHHTTWTLLQGIEKTH